MPRGLARPAILLCLVAVAAAAMPSAAAARVTVAPQVSSADGVTRITVTVTNTRAFSSRTKPRAVAVIAGRRSYKLRAVRSRSRKVSTWRSSAYRGSRGRAVARLAGKSVRVRIKSKARTTTVRRRAVLAPQQDDPGTNPPPETGGGGGGTTPPPANQPLFEAPSSELSGEAAYNHFRRYFEDSRFTDCVPGWPNCAVENRYVHCPNGGWAYRRLTPTSGSDINSVNSYTVTGAAVRTDGSWVVEYQITEYGAFYHWEVAADGSVTGFYQHESGTTEQFAGYAWVKPGGEC